MSIRQQSPLQARFYQVIFGTETRAGKWFDIILIAIIVSSVGVIMLDSIPERHAQHAQLFLDIEWIFTLLFTVEYATRVWCAPNRRAYILSAYGLVDLASLLPTYLSLLLPQASPLLIIRLLRILRIFRVLRLLSLLREANDLAAALRRSGQKIFVFFTMMIILTTIFGCLMYVIEGSEHGFSSIPKSIYWAIVTITTVGYGDVVPHTSWGRAISSVAMLIGYAVIAVPTGIITAEISLGHKIRQDAATRTLRNCTTCAAAEPDATAHYCRQCGSSLPNPGHTSD